MNAKGAGELASLDEDDLAAAVSRASEGRIAYVAEALRRGWSVERLYDATRIDPWFLDRLHDMIAVQEAVRGLRVEDIDPDSKRLLKQNGTS